MRIGKKKVTLFPWMMWILATVFYFYEFFLQVSPGVMVKELMHAFSVEAAALGFLASLYYYTYAAMQIPAGILLDRFGARKLVTFAAMMCALGVLLFISSHFFVVAALGRLLTGLGAAFSILSCLYIAATYLPKRLFSFLAGITLSIGLLGAIFAQMPLALLVSKFDWDLALLPLVFVGIIIAILAWTLIRDKPKAAKKDFDKEKKKLLQDLKYIVANRQSWIISVQCGFMITPAVVFAVVWGVPFISVKYNLLTSMAATIVSMLFVGWIVGAPIIGWLSDHFKKRRLFLFISVLGALLNLALVIYLPGNITHVAAEILLFCFGFFSSGIVLTFTIIKEINPPTVTGSAIGFMNCISMLGGILVPPLIGFILDIGKKNMTDSAFLVNDFKIALALLPLSLIIAFIMLFWVKEP